MLDLKPRACPISGVLEARRVFLYHAPPPREIGFKRPEGEPYYREVWQFELSNHYVSRHAMTVATGYDGAYVDATYSNDEASPRRSSESSHFHGASRTTGEGRAA